MYLLLYCEYLGVSIWLYVYLVEWYKSCPLDRLDRGQALHPEPVALDYASLKGRCFPTRPIIIHVSLITMHYVSLSLKSTPSYMKIRTSEE